MSMRNAAVRSGMFVGLLGQPPDKEEEACTSCMSIEERLPRERESESKSECV
jgi:hypothetical protein